MNGCESSLREKNGDVEAVRWSDLFGCIMQEESYSKGVTLMENADSEPSTGLIRRATTHQTRNRDGLPDTWSVPHGCAERNTGATLAVHRVSHLTMANVASGRTRRLRNLPTCSAAHDMTCSQEHAVLRERHDFYA